MLTNSTTKSRLSDSSKSGWVYIEIDPLLSSWLPGLRCDIAGNLGRLGIPFACLPGAQPVTIQGKCAVPAGVLDAQLHVRAWIVEGRLTTLRLIAPRQRRTRIPLIGPSSTTGLS